MAHQTNVFVCLRLVSLIEVHEKYKKDKSHSMMFSHVPGRLQVTFQVMHVIEFSALVTYCPVQINSKHILAFSRGH